MRARTVGAVVTGLVVGILATSWVADDAAPQPLVVTQHLNDGAPKIKYVDRPTSRVPASCLDMVAAAVDFNEATEDFYQTTGKAADKLRQIRNSLEDGPKVLDKLIAEYDALEVGTFVQSVNSDTEPSAKRMADFMTSYQALQARCLDDVKDNAS